MAKGFLSQYGDYVIGSNGLPVAGASVSLFRATDYAVGTVPSGASGAPATAVATTTTNASGAWTVSVAPDDYHVLAQYTPPGGALQSVWRYFLPIAASDMSKRGFASGRQSLLPRTLGRLFGQQNTTILVFGDDTAVGYNATGTTTGGWVALFAAALAAAYPSSTVVRQDPHNFAVTVDAAIPSWDATTVQTGSNGQTITVVNAGVKGDTALRVLRRFANLTTSWPAADCVVLALGQAESIASDAQRFVSGPDYQAHLEACVNIVRTLSAAEVLLCTPHANPTVGNIDDYASAARAVAARLNCSLCDFRQLWLDRYVAGGANDGYDPWLNSGVSRLFPIDAGHAAMATEMMRSFVPALGVPFDGGVLGAGKVYELVRVPYSSSQVALAGAGWGANGGYTLVGLNSSGGSFEQVTTHAGDTATIIGRFTDLYMLTRRFTDCGQVGVQVDGGGTTIVDLYRANPASTSDLGSPDGAIAPQDRVQLCHGLADAVHTVVVTEQGTKNAASSGFKWHLESFKVGRWRRCGYEVESVDAQGTLQRGSGSVTFAAVAQATLAVTFARAFTVGSGTFPTVVATALDPNFYCAVSALTNTGFTLTCVHRDGTNFTGSILCNWLVFG